MDWRKARCRHKYGVNTARGEREIIRAPFNLRCTLEKDELNLAGAAGGRLPSGKVGACYANETTVRNNGEFHRPECGQGVTKAMEALIGTKITIL